MTTHLKALGTKLWTLRRRDRLWLKWPWRVSRRNPTMALESGILLASKSRLRSVRKLTKLLKGLSSPFLKRLRENTSACSPKALSSSSALSPLRENARPSRTT
jgi:hypothetical protein